MTHTGYTFSRGLSRLPNAAIEAALDDVLATVDEERRRRLLMCPDILTAELELRLQFRMPDEEGDPVMFIEYAGQLWTVYHAEDLMEFLDLAGYTPRPKAGVEKVLFNRLVEDLNEWRA
jgi:hypothetical protein